MNKPLHFHKDDLLFWNQIMAFGNCYSAAVGVPFCGDNDLLHPNVKGDDFSEAEFIQAAEADGLKYLGMKFCAPARGHYLVEAMVDFYPHGPEMYWARYLDAEYRVSEMQVYDWQSYFHKWGKRGRVEITNRPFCELTDGNYKHIGFFQVPLCGADIKLSSSENFADAHKLYLAAMYLRGEKRRRKMEQAANLFLEIHAGLQSKHRRTL